MIDPIDFRELCEVRLRFLGHAVHANCLQAKREIKMAAQSARRSIGQHWRHAKKDQAR